MQAAEQMAAYKRMFCGSDAREQLHALAMSGGLRSSGLRSVAWKTFLGVVPAGSGLQGWKTALAASRAAYEGHKEKFLVDPYKDGEAGKDLINNNPLAQAEDSSWKKYFELQELQKDIQIDLERLNFDDPLFAEDGPHFARVQGVMLRILTIWASLHPAISYRQGMHELLAPLIAVLERDCVQGSDSAPPPDTDEVRLLHSVTDHAYVEHDGYALFAALLALVSESFAPQERKKGKDGQYERPGGVVARCDRMQHTLLRAKDYELYIHLQSQSIEPQLYSMKWIRLLLGREFHLEDVLLLWDAMFADHYDTLAKGSAQGGGEGASSLPAGGGRGLELLEFLCLAMLIYIRSDLLGKDNMGCLQRLMKYPPVEDVKVFISSAQHLRNTANTTPSAATEVRQRPPLPPGGPPPAATAKAPPKPPAQPPPAMSRAGDSGAGGGAGWLLGGSAPASTSYEPPATPVAAGGGGAGEAPLRGAGGQVAFVGGQVVHVGVGGVGLASNGVSSRPDAAPATKRVVGGGREGAGQGSGRELMNGALAVKMNLPLAVLAGLVPPPGDARRCLSYEFLLNHVASRLLLSRALCHSGH